MDDDKTARIRRLNDKFRKTGLGGTVMLTSGVDARSAETKQRIVDEVRDFTSFSKDNDPFAEHDFGAFELDGEKMFWKIDYYDLEMKAGSPDPSDPSKTMRVLTIMLASEY